MKPLAGASGPSSLIGGSNPSLATRRLGRTKYQETLSKASREGLNRSKRAPIGVVRLRLTGVPESGNGLGPAWVSCKTALSKRDRIARLFHRAHIPETGGSNPPPAI